MAQLPLDDARTVLPVGKLCDCAELFIDFNTLCNPRSHPALVSAARNFVYPEPSPHIFDFSNPDHLAALCALRSLDVPDEYLDTFNFYAQEADIDDCARDILALKLRHKQNPEIAQEVNNKWNKSYNVNYISTIYRKRILTAIADAAKQHKAIIEHLTDTRNFKQCADCGRWYLRSPDNFVRKTRAIDGLTNRCKRCDRERRANR